MAWIVKLPAIPATQTRWQMRYPEGITKRDRRRLCHQGRSASVKRAVERGEYVAYSDQLSLGDWFCISR